MRSRGYALYFLLVLPLLLIGGILVSAQGAGESSSILNQTSFGIGTGITAFSNPDTGIRITTFPEFPRPGEKVIVRLEGTAADFGQSTISWFVNGSPVAKGVGTRSITLSAGDTGVETHITADILTDKGRSFTAEHTIKPSTVELIWEALTYTPPFYEGKAQQSTGSRVRLVAFPSITDNNGNLIAAKDLVFTWRQGTQIMKDKSGRGMQSVVVSNQNVVGPLDISVSVATPNGAGGAFAKISLRVKDPEIVFYQNHPLLGMLYEHALPQDSLLKDSEVNVVAEPYFFSGNSKSADSLSYNWLINGSPQDALSNTGSTIVLRGNTTGAAAAHIDLRIRSKTQYLQSARQTLTISSGN